MVNCLEVKENVGPFILPAKLGRERLEDPGFAPLESSSYVSQRVGQQWCQEAPTGPSGLEILAVAERIRPL